MAERLTIKSVEKYVSAGAKVDIRDSSTRGLVLRVWAPGKWAWNLRRSSAGKDVRIDLGNGWTLDEAREIAEEASRWCRNHRNPFSPYGTHRIDFDRWVAKKASLKLGTSVEPPPKGVFPAEVAKAPPPSIRWDEAVREWLEDSANWLRRDTVSSYRRALAVREMDRFKGRMVREISRPEMAEAIAAIHRRGAERQAEATAICVRVLFGWLADDERVRRTSVQPRIMSELRPPRKKLVEENDGEGLHVPPRKELGLILRWLRSPDSDALERDRLAGQLLLFACQRRRTVAAARVADFEDLNDGMGLWRIPAPHRKTASIHARKGNDVGIHFIPLPPAAWAVVERAKKLAGESSYLFPAVRKRRASVDATTMAPDSLTHLFAVIPGNEASPHDIRRGLGTTFRQKAGYRVSDVGLILDHGRREDFDEDNAEKVTAEHYAFSGVGRKAWEIMNAWCDFLESAAAEWPASSPSPAADLTLAEASS